MWIISGTTHDDVLLLEVAANYFKLSIQPIKYISQIDIPAELFHYKILQVFLRRSFMGKMAQFSVRCITRRILERVNFLVLQAFWLSCE